MKLCSNCGSQCEENADICQNCGNSIEKAPDPGTQQPDPMLPEQTQPSATVQTLQQPSTSHSNSSGAKFAQKYLGFVGLGVLLLFTVQLLIQASFSNIVFISLINLTNTLNQFWLYGIIALGTVVVTRIKGPDLSIGQTMALACVIIAMSANEGNLYAGIISAFLICCIYGLFNGILLSFLNIPAVILTLITAALLRGIMFILTDFQPIAIGSMLVNTKTQSITAFIISVLIALTALLITNRLPVLKIGKNSLFRQKLKDALGYAFIAVIAGIAGLSLLGRTGAATANVGSGYEAFIIMVFAAVQCSKLLKNNIAAMGCGLLVTLVFIMIRNALAFLYVDVPMQTVIEAAMALFMLCIACAAQGGWKSMLNSNLSACTEKDTD